MLRIRHVSLFLVAFVLCAVLGFSAPGWAQKGDKDLAEIERYTLTMDKLNRAAQVMTDAQAAEKADPSLKNSLDSKGDSGNEDLDQASARLASSPVLVGILKKNGFTPREFVVMTMAMIQASLASYTKPKDESVEHYAAKVHANPANIVFVQQHAAELEAMQKKAKSLEKDDTDSGDADGGDAKTP